jgi:hypothetical protein
MQRRKVVWRDDDDDVCGAELSRGATRFGDPSAVEEYAAMLGNGFGFFDGGLAPTVMV